MCGLYLIIGRRLDDLFRLRLTNDNLIPGDVDDLLAGLHWHVNLILDRIMKSFSHRMSGRVVESILNITFNDCCCRVILDSNDDGLVFIGDSPDNRLYTLTIDVLAVKLACKRGGPLSGILHYLDRLGVRNFRDDDTPFCCRYFDGVLINRDVSAIEDEAFRCNRLDIINCKIALDLDRYRCLPPIGGLSGDVFDELHHLPGIHRSDVRLCLTPADSGDRHRKRRDNANCHFLLIVFHLLLQTSLRVLSSNSL